MENLKLDDSIHNDEYYLMKRVIKLEEHKSGQHMVYFKYAPSDREKFLLEKILEHSIWSYENESQRLKDCLKTCNLLFVSGKK